MSEVKKCSICGKDVHTQSLCEMCSLIIKSLNTNYDLTQTMTMFTNVLGAKLVKDITMKFMQNVEAEYWQKFVNNLDKKKIN